MMVLDSGLTDGDVTFRTAGAFGSECSPGRLTYGGTPVLEPLEHSVLEMTLDGRPLVEMSVL